MPNFGNLCQILVRVSNSGTSQLGRTVSLVLYSQSSATNSPRPQAWSQTSTISTIDVLSTTSNVQLTDSKPMSLILPAIYTVSAGLINQSAFTLQTSTWNNRRGF